MVLGVHTTIPTCYTHYSDNKSMLTKGTTVQVYVSFKVMVLNPFPNTNHNRKTNPR